MLNSKFARGETSILFRARKTFLTACKRNQHPKTALRKNRHSETHTEILLNFMRNRGVFIERLFSIPSCFGLNA